MAGVVDLSFLLSLVCNVRMNYEGRSTLPVVTQQPNPLLVCFVELQNAFSFLIHLNPKP